MSVAQGLLLLTAQINVWSSNTPLSLSLYLFFFIFLVAFLIFYPVSLYTGQLYHNAAFASGQACLV